MWWHTTAHIYSLTLWEIQSLRSVSLGQGQGVAGVVASRGSGGECFLLFWLPEASCIPWLMVLSLYCSGLLLPSLQLHLLFGKKIVVILPPTPPGERYDLEVTVEERILFPPPLG